MENDEVISAEEQSILANLAKQKYCNDFARLLSTIPNFPLKLSAEELSLIRSPGNVIAMGRSGTGKTTCSLLRLFAMQVTFKYWVQKYERVLAPEDLDAPSSIHSVFVTAAPVLCSEVKAYYLKLLSNIKSELKKKSDGVFDLAEEVLYDNEDLEALIGDGIPASLTKLSNEHFPLFLTVRRLIFMIDASLGAPFFRRDNRGQIKGLSSKFEWHNESRGLMGIDKEFKSTQELAFEEGDSSDSEEEVVEKLASKSKELTFKEFQSLFWPIVRYSATVDEFLLWNEINSYITGSARAYEFPSSFLPKSEYLAIPSALDQATKESIYNLFMRYKCWKQSHDYFDFNDVVNHVLKELARFGPNVPEYLQKIHYMMIDEVQDLPEGTALLLLKVTSHNVFFSGDVAQTIAQSVSFKVNNLHALLKKTGHASPSMIHLSQNFRSSDSILRVANSVVSALNLFFPTSIDNLGQEFSELSGPMPTIVDSERVSDLLREVFSQDVKVGDLNFGCNMVVLVRNQEAKDKIPPELRTALCLTIYEAKGLEFNQVVLFNFFSDSSIHHHRWKVLENIKTVAEYAKEGVFIPIDPRKDPDSTFSTVKTPSSKYAPLMCPELKQLYVALTRAKEKLIIYDQSLSSRTHFDAYWLRLGVVQPASACTKVEENLESSNAQWKRQGFIMFKHGFFENAARCFESASEHYLCLRARAHHQANIATNLLGEATGLIEEYKSNRKNLPKHLKNRIRNLKSEAFKMFEEAGLMFLDCKEGLEDTEQKQVIKNAARCFASCSFYSKAGNLFESIGMIAQAAEAYLANSDFLKAGALFEESGETFRAIDAYCKGKEWEKIIYCIHNSRESFSSQELKKMLYKFLPAAFESLTTDVLNTQTETNYVQQILKEYGAEAINEVDEEDEDDDSVDYDSQVKNFKPNQELFGNYENHEKVYENNEEACENKEEAYENHEEAYENKEEAHENHEEAYENHENNEEAYEKDDEVYEFDDEAYENNENASDNQEETLEELKHEESLEKKSALSDSFELLSNKSSKSHKLSESSFMLLNSSIDSSRLAIEALHDLDPDDPLLLTEKGSVVDSICSVIQKDGAISSEYSILDTHSGFGNSHQIIKTRPDIYAEDCIMRKIIEYLSLFSCEIGGYLREQRSHESLMVSQLIDDEWSFSPLIDLDELDMSMLGLLLDALEEFQMYRLCLIVCNRYGINDRIGRFLVSIASRYSNINDLSRHCFKFQSLASSQMQRAVVAFTAFHNCLEMINSEYLLLHSKNIEAFQGLLLLGYWKKILFIMDRENGLTLAHTFYDFTAFKELYSCESKDLLVWANAEEIDNDIHPYAGTMCLEEFLFAMNEFLNVTLKCTRTDRDFCFASSPLFSYNQMFWNQMFHNDYSRSEFQTILFKGIDLLMEQSSSHLQTIDIASFFVQIVFASETKGFFSEILKDSSAEDFEKFLVLIGKITNSLRDCKDSDLIKGVYSCLGVKCIERSQVTTVLPIDSHVLVHKYSTVLSSLDLRNDNNYIVDLEANTIIVPKNVVNTQISKNLLIKTSKIIESRGNLHFHLRHSSSWKKTSAEAVQKLGNYLGELLFVENLSNSLNNKIQPLDKTPVPLGHLFNEHNEYTELMKEYKLLFSDIDEDILHAFNNKKLQDMKQRLKILARKHNVLVYDVSKNRCLVNLIDWSRYLFSDFRPLTSLARNSILSVVHRLVLECENTQVTSIDYPLFVSFELAKISGCLYQFEELMYSRFKAIIEKGKKRPKFSEEFRYALGWIDMQVFYEENDFGQLSNTAIELLEAVHARSDLKMQVFLIERAVISWLLTLPNPIVIPSHLIQHVPYIDIQSKNLVVEGIAKGCEQEVPRGIIKWISEIIQRIGESVFEVKDAHALLGTLYDLLLTSCKYLHPSYFRSRILEFGLLGSVRIAQGIRKMGRVLSNIVKEKDLKSLDKQINALSLENVFCSYYSIRKNGFVPKEETNKRLDSKWFNEMKTLALRKESALKIRKLKEKYNKNSDKVDLHVLKTLEHDILNCLYNAGIRKALDIHFLLDNIQEIQRSKDEGFDPTEIAGKIEKLKTWKRFVIPKSKNIQAKNKKQWRLKWKNRRRRRF